MCSCCAGRASWQQLRRDQCTSVPQNFKLALYPVDVASGNPDLSVLLSEAIIPATGVSGGGYRTFTFEQALAPSTSYGMVLSSVAPVTGGSTWFLPTPASVPAGSNGFQFENNTAFRQYCVGEPSCAAGW